MSRLPALLLAPIVLAQARRVSRDTPRLAPPPEPWTGVAGSGPVVSRVLVVGDSTAIGTGVAEAADGLAGQLARLLAGAAPASGTAPATAVAWRAAGRNGATSAEVLAEILPSVLDDPADLVVVVVGWNDALRLRSARAFARDLEVLARTLAARRLTRRVVIVGAPRFDRLAVLPQPLRRALGAHAAGLRRTAARVGARWGLAVAVGFDGASTASDRFHPDAAGYARLAAAVAQAVAPGARAGSGAAPRR